MKPSKLALGTVQFGMDYGISNEAGVTSVNEINSILDYAFLAGIRILDTAYLYGMSEERLGNYNSSHFEIISKFSNVTNHQALLDEFSISLKKLNRESIYAYLAHNANTIIENPVLWDTLNEIKQIGQVGKIGYSLYTTEQLDTLLSMNMIPDIVQLPFSIFDRKFESYFAELKRLGTEIHVRSVFLQGLYFMNPEEIPSKLDPLKKPLSEFKNYCKEYEISTGYFALNYALNNSFIDKVVIGVNNTEQLRFNLNLVQQNANFDIIKAKIESIVINNKELLNPAKWN